tara:strand:+ start:603 stop:803 length:201 start_codon:yes stop_codon:yes gene_type:complete
MPLRDARASSIDDLNELSNANSRWFPMEFPFSITARILFGPIVVDDNLSEKEYKTEFIPSLDELTL